MKKELWKKATAGNDIPQPENLRQLKSQGNALTFVFVIDILSRKTFKFSHENHHQTTTELIAILLYLYAVYYIFPEHRGNNFASRLL